MSKLLRFLLPALVLVCGAAQAQQATLTLFPEVAMWNDVIEARIEGTGCTGEIDGPFIVGSRIDIPLRGCHPSTLGTFSTVVKLGPLYPHDFTVRVYDASTPASVVFDTATLSVRREASVDIDLPTDARDNGLILIKLRFPASSLCYSLDPPEVHGNVIEATFTDNCPVLPPGPPLVREEEFDVGPLPAGEYDVRFFETSGTGRALLHRETLTVHDSDGCVPSEIALCLQNDRFRVEVNWKDFQNNTGKGHAIPLEGRDDSGLFWFFKEENIELTVKVLNGCGLGGHWWVFLSSGSTVEYTVTVTDTLTHRTKTYTNDSGEAAPLLADTAAFSCVP